MTRHYMQVCCCHDPKGWQCLAEPAWSLCYIASYSRMSLLSPLAMSPQADYPPTPHKSILHVETAPHPLRQRSSSRSRLVIEGGESQITPCSRKRSRLEYISADSNISQTHHLPSQSTPAPAPSTVPAHPLTTPSTEIVPFAVEAAPTHQDAVPTSTLLPIPVPTSPLTTLMGALDAAYWFALSSIGAVFRLDVSMFVLQDWDEEEGSLKVSFRIKFDILFSLYRRLVATTMSLSCHTARLRLGSLATVQSGEHLRSASTSVRLSFMLRS